MKAVVCERYGPPEVVVVREVAKPAPRDAEVLIRVHAAAVSSGDARMRSMVLPRGFGLMGRLALGISRPRNPVFGFECSGEIESVGAGVSRFKPGDQVIASGGFGLGCHAEYKTVAEDGLVAPKPANLTHAEAASLCFGGTTALYFLRKGNLQAGETVLVNGASGAVGAATVQLAKHFGAEVTGVCSTANIDLVTGLGADYVVDYTSRDFSSEGKAYDVIVDTVGTAPYARARTALKEGGRLLLVLAGLPEMLQAPLVSLMGSRKVIGGTPPDRPADIRLLAELAEVGALRPVLDRTYPLGQVVEAYRHVDTGRKKGNVVLTFDAAV